jgi:hypothetical protein
VNVPDSLPPQVRVLIENPIYVPLDDYRRRWIKDGQVDVAAIRKSRESAATDSHSVFELLTAVAPVRGTPYEFGVGEYKMSFGEITRIVGWK